MTFIAFEDLTGDPVAVNPALVTDITTGTDGDRPISIIWFGRGSVKVIGTVVETAIALKKRK